MSVKPEYLNQRQFEFAENYLQCQNATQAALQAGYKAKTAAVQGCQLLKNPKVHKYIQERMDNKNKKKIADTDEILEYYTRVMRGEERDQFDLDPSLQERTKAAAELAKRVFIDTTTESKVTIINNIPKPTNME